MIPIWRPCATKGAFSLSTQSSARIACQSASSRVPLLLPRPQTGTSFSRSISSSLSHIQSHSTSNHLPAAWIPSPLEYTRFDKSTTNHVRYYSSLRRSSTRRSDQPVTNPFSSAKPSSSRFPNLDRAEPKSTGQLPDKLTLIHKVENELAPTGVEGLKVGSSEWYEYYSQKAREEAKVDDKLDPDDIPAIRRLLPSAMFLVVILGGCFYYATTYIPPPTAARMFPNVPMAMATVWGIVAANGLVFLLWRIRPLWKFLNTYFVQRPGDPRFFALIGNTFSHHTFWHFGANMLGLFFLGTTLCEQIGRGNFLALYLASGGISSFASLAFNVLTKRFFIFGLGASGAVFGVVGAYATLNPDRELYFILLPFFGIKSATLVTGMGVWEFLSLVFGWKMWMDHMAHLAGLLSGVGLISWLKAEARRRREAALKRQLTENR
ncbi:P-beta [Arthrobotrys entomopaga]|nr:P-beta [Arthrobotrys entomopaga]